jgi:hypothetical protein
MGRTAIISMGKGFALLPGPDSLDVVRMKFFQELDPLFISVAIPQITISPTSP